MILKHICLFSVLFLCNLISLSGITNKNFEIVRQLLDEKTIYYLLLPNGLRRVIQNIDSIEFFEIPKDGIRTINNEELFLYHLGSPAIIRTKIGTLDDIMGNLSFFPNN